MSLYHQTIKHSTSFSIACHGSFVTPNAINIVAVSGNGSTLNILEADDSGQLSIIHTCQAWGTIQNVCVIPGNPIMASSSKNTDYLAISSDSGRFIIARFSQIENRWKQVAESTYGRSGVRKDTPGRYLAIDPSGQVIMVAALEKTKFVYFIETDNNSSIKLSSPMVAHRNDHHVHDICALDMGVENPCFAVLESPFDPTGIDTNLRELTKFVTFYSVEKGTKHVLRKISIKVDPSTHRLLALPSFNTYTSQLDINSYSTHSYGPGGLVAVGSKELVWIHHRVSSTISVKLNGSPILSTCVIPGIRNQNTSQPLDPSTYACFIVGIDANGKSWKCQFSCDLDSIKRSKLFHSIPKKRLVAEMASSLLPKDRVKKIVVTECANMKRYSQLVPLGLRPFLFGCGEICNSDLIHIIYNESDLDSSSSDDSDEESENTTSSLQKTNHTKLVFPLFQSLSQLPTSGPLLGSTVTNLVLPKSPTPQIHLQVGQYPNAKLSVLRHGLTIDKLFDYPFPNQQPKHVWTLPNASQPQIDGFLVISFDTSTVVLEISGNEFKNVSHNLGFDSNETLFAHYLPESKLYVQCCPTKINFSTSKGVVKHVWKPDSTVFIVSVHAFENQFILSTSQGKLFYFEFLPNSETKFGNYSIAADGKWSGIIPDDQADILDLGIRATHVKFAPPLGSSSRAEMIAVTVCPPPKSPFGSNTDQFVQIAQQMPGMVLLLNCKDFSVVGRQALPNPLNLPNIQATDIEFCTLSLVFKTKHAIQKRNTIVLCTGLSTGMMMDSIIDSVSGHIKKPQFRLVGASPVSFSKLVEINPTDDGPGKRHESIMVHSDQSHNFLAHNGFRRMYPLISKPLLSCTPITLEEGSTLICSCIPNSLSFFSIEEPSSMIPFSQIDIALEYSARKVVVSSQFKKMILMESDIVNGIPKALIRIIGYETVGPNETLGHYGEPLSTFHIHRFPDGSRPTSCCLVKFETDEKFAVALIDSQNQPQIWIFDLVFGPSITFTLHSKTMINHPAFSMISFAEKLVVGVGSCLCLYALGKSRLLLKTMHAGFPSAISSIHTPDHSTRLFVGCVNNSIFFVHYSVGDQQFYIFCDDTVPRYVTSVASLDRNTCVASDKFGNVFSLAVPHNQINHFDADPTGSKLKSISKQTYLNGVALKAQLLSHFFTGDTVMSVCKTSFAAGGGTGDLATLMSTLKLKAGYVAANSLKIVDPLDIIGKKHKYYPDGTAVTDSDDDDDSKMIPEVLISSLREERLTLIFYSTISGQLGIFLPIDDSRGFRSKPDITLFSQLESLLISSKNLVNGPLVGLPIPKYRGYYQPTKSVIDGDILQQFQLLDNPTQLEISDSIEKSHDTIIRKLTEVFHRVF